MIADPDMFEEMMWGSKKDKPDVATPSPSFRGAKRSFRGRSPSIAGSPGLQGAARAALGMGDKPVEVWRV